ncbi:MAG: universal stress protein [Calditrichaeota bacterium]|nr:MAG: universal stress protein [Calditrichota bacterium]
MNIKKILCAVDFSDVSERAVLYSAEIASRYDASLHLLHVIEYLPGMDHYLILALPPQEIYQKLADQAEDKLKELTKQIQQEVPVEYEVREGKAFVEIVGKAREIGADLIVIGSHGKTGLAHILIGSVAEKVARKASCSVLIYRDKGVQFEMP